MVRKRALLEDPFSFLVINHVELFIALLISVHNPWNVDVSADLKISANPTATAARSAYSTNVTPRAFPTRRAYVEADSEARKVVTANWIRINNAVIFFLLKDKQV